MLTGIIFPTRTKHNACNQQEKSKPSGGVQENKWCSCPPSITLSGNGTTWSYVLVSALFVDRPFWTFFPLQHFFPLIQAFATAKYTIKQDIRNPLCVWFWVHPFCSMCVDPLNGINRLLKVHRHFGFCLFSKPNTHECIYSKYRETGPKCRQETKLILAGSSLLTHLTGHKEYDEELTI